MKHSLLAMPALMVLAAALPAVEPERPAAAETTAVVRGNTSFAFDLYGQLRSKEGNLFFSPYSISAALAMTSTGARGQTLDEMNKALHLPPQEQLHPAFRTLSDGINGDPSVKRGYQLSTANRLWGMKDYGFKADFLKSTKDHYGAGLEEVDFGSEEQVRKTINGWVEKETKDKIKDLIKPGMLTTDTRLVLTNAIYFKGDWVSQFKKDATKDEPFFLGSGQQVKTPLMHQTGAFKYGDTTDLQALELPYVGKDLSMVVLLPKKADGLADVEKGLDADKVNGLLSRMHTVSGIAVTLPKFKTTTEFEMNKELKALGMKQAFLPGAADFSGMASKPGDLYIGFVVHKAFVDVNEEGTEAAAATGVGVTTTSSIQPPKPIFRADHPFVFMIRDNKSGSILFMGRLADPTK